MPKLSKVRRNLQHVYDEIVEDCLKFCNREYDIDYQMANNFLTKKEKKTFLLPFVGIVEENMCKAIKYASGLHIQCRKLLDKDSDYCEKHTKEALKSESNKPLIGDIRDRKECPLLDYIDLQNRRTKPYIHVVTQKKMNKSECLYQAKKRGVIIPEEHWKERICRRGRPKKKHIIAVTDTDSEDDNIIDKMRNANDEANDDEANDSEANDSQVENIILYETDEGYVDEQLGVVYSKETRNFIRFL